MTQAMVAAGSAAKIQAVPEAGYIAKMKVAVDRLMAIEGTVMSLRGKLDGRPEEAANGQVTSNLHSLVDEALRLTARIEEEVASIENLF